MNGIAQNPVQWSYQNNTRTNSGLRFLQKGLTVEIIRKAMCESGILDFWRTEAVKRTSLYAVILLAVVKL